VLTKSGKATLTAHGLTVTAHGDGLVREKAHRAAALPGGHGVVQRAGTRRTVDRSPSGRASVVAGTHTHAPTADHQILPHGTAFIADVEMSCDYDSIIGMDKSEPLTLVLRKIPGARFEPASDEATLCALAVETDDATRASVRLRIYATLPATFGDEGYRLNVSPRGVEIIARSGAGLFYGVQTLDELTAADATPSVAIDDWPAYRWRGIHLDVSRHFYPVSVVERYIDVAAHFKLNSFHWHLTDDQGWRIAIRRYPRLTTVGTGGPARLRVGLGHRVGVETAAQPQHFRVDHGAAPPRVFPLLQQQHPGALAQHETVTAGVERPRHLMRQAVRGTERPQR